MPKKRPPTRMNDAPKIVNKHGLTPKEEEERVFLCSRDEPPMLVFTNIPYSDYNGNTKIIVGAVYSVTRKLLPPWLPDLLPPLKSPPAYGIRDIPGKGKGVIATRNIALGEIVIIERPILITPCVLMSGNHWEFFPIYAKESMTPEVWEKFNGLANAKDIDVSKFDGIRATNGFEIHLMGGKESYGGVFLELSRLNHSCGPNLETSWNTDLFTFSAQAVRPIRAGEELTVTYEYLGRSRANRRFDLQRKYKFDCTCGYCTKPSPTSDFDRALARSTVIIQEYGAMYNDLLRPGLSHHGGQRDAKLLLNALIRSLVSVKREGFESESATWHYFYLMMVWGLLGDKKRFKEWGFKAVLTSVNYIEDVGERACGKVEQWIDWVKEPEKNFPGWGRFR